MEISTDYLKAQIEGANACMMAGYEQGYQAGLRDATAAMEAVLKQLREKMESAK